MTSRRLTIVRTTMCFVILTALALSMWTPTFTTEAMAKKQANQQNGGPAMIVKGCQMVSGAVTAFNETKDTATMRKRMTESCNVLSQGRELMMKDQKLMMSSERLGVGLEMMVSGCKMISYGLKKIEQNKDEAGGKKLVAEGKNMVTDGKKLFDEGMTTSGKK